MRTASGMLACDRCEELSQADTGSDSWLCETCAVTADRDAIRADAQAAVRTIAALTESEVRAAERRVVEAARDYIDYPGDASTRLGAALRDLDALEGRR